MGFVVGSCMGFVLASMRYYHTCLAQALNALAMYLRVMQLHLVEN
jgi:hypothetical protein